jgi:hypothetical protein
MGVAVRNRDFVQEMLAKSKELSSQEFLEFVEQLIKEMDKQTRDTVSGILARSRSRGTSTLNTTATMSHFDNEPSSEISIRPGNRNQFEQQIFSVLMDAILGAERREE